MKITNIYEAKTKFSKLIEEVLNGNEVIIGKAGKPVARLIPYAPEVKDRVGGQWMGQVEIADDFDELPDDLLSAFNGETP